MTTEEKQLLLKDLCARLPYGVKLYHEGDYGDNIGKLESVNINDDECVIWNYNGTDTDIFDIEACKPYLRPVSSITENEMDKLFEIAKVNPDGTDEDWISINDVKGIRFHFLTGRYADTIGKICDYLDSIYIDYRELIPKGLALEAPKDMYKI